MATFVSTASRYNVAVHHLSGYRNLHADFGSRHPTECGEDKCQVCDFIHDMINTPVLRHAPVEDPLDGPVFTSRPAWINIQNSCAELRRVKAHLHQGTRPGRKQTNIRDIKRYLQTAIVESDGLLTAPPTNALTSRRPRIVVPRQVAHGLLTAIHLRLSHPTAHQLKQLIQRYFFLLDCDTVVQAFTNACASCAALIKAKHLRPQFSSHDPPPHIGSCFAADVMRRCRQYVLVVRECATSYTTTCLIDSERAEDLKPSLIAACLPMRLADGPPATIRCDPGPGFMALRLDPTMQEARLQVEIGDPKNNNKNPVAERAVQELRIELQKRDPEGNSVSPSSLALATAIINGRIRHYGLSAREALFQRDQFTGHQLPFSDDALISTQHKLREANHLPSATSKAPRAPFAPVPDIAPGTLVYVNSDRNKTTARPRYLVTQCDNGWCSLKKFTGNQLRDRTYRVATRQCYPVPGQVSHMPPSDHVDDDQDEDGEPPTTDLPEVAEPLGQGDLVPEIPPSVEEPPGTPAAAVTPLPFMTPAKRLLPDRPRKPPAWHKDYLPH